MLSSLEEMTFYQTISAFDEYIITDKTKQCLSMNLRSMPKCLSIVQPYTELIVLHLVTKSKKYCLLLKESVKISL